MSEKRKRNGEKKKKSRLSPFDNKKFELKLNEKTMNKNYLIYNKFENTLERTYEGTKIHYAFFKKITKKYCDKIDNKVSIKVLKTKRGKIQLGLTDIVGKNEKIRYYRINPSNKLYEIKNGDTIGFLYNSLERITEFYINNILFEKIFHIDIDEDNFYKFVVGLKDSGDKIEIIKEAESTEIYINEDINPKYLYNKKEINYNKKEKTIEKKNENSGYIFCLDKISKKNCNDEENSFKFKILNTKEGFISLSLNYLYFNPKTWYYNSCRFIEIGNYVTLGNDEDEILNAKNGDVVFFKYNSKKGTIKIFINEILKSKTYGINIIQDYRFGITLWDKNDKIQLY